MSVRAHLLTRVLFRGCVRGPVPWNCRRITPRDCSFGHGSTITCRPQTPFDSQPVESRLVLVGQVGESSGCTYRSGVRIGSNRVVLQRAMRRIARVVLLAFRLGLLSNLLLSGGPGANGGIISRSHACDCGAGCSVLSAIM